MTLIKCPNLKVTNNAIILSKVTTSRFRIIQLALAYMMTKMVHATQVLKILTRKRRPLASSSLLICNLDHLYSICYSQFCQFSRCSYCQSLPIGKSISGRSYSIHKLSQENWPLIYLFKGKKTIL